MNRIVVTMFLFVLAGCQSEKDAKIESLRSELDAVRDSLSSCDYAETQLQKEQADVAKAQWDIAAANNMDSIAPDQEAEIRESLGDRMGIAPSQVDWRGIYKSRADAGNAKLSGRNYALELAQEQVRRSCGTKGKDQQRAWQLEDEIKRLGGIA